MMVLLWSRALLISYRVFVLAINRSLCSYLLPLLSITSTVTSLALTLGSAATLGAAVRQSRSIGYSRTENHRQRPETLRLMTLQPPFHLSDPGTLLPVIVHPFTTSLYVERFASTSIVFTDLRYSYTGICPPQSI